MGRLLMDNCGTMYEPVYYETYSIHIPGLRKKRTCSYTRSSEMLSYSYTALCFCIHLLLVVRQISQSIH